MLTRHRRELVCLTNIVRTPCEKVNACSGHCTGRSRHRSGQVLSRWTRPCNGSDVEHTQSDTAVHCCLVGVTSSFSKTVLCREARAWCGPILMPAPSHPSQSMRSIPPAHAVAQSGPAYGSDRWTALLQAALPHRWHEPRARRAAAGANSRIHIWKVGICYIRYTLCYVPPLLRNKTM